MLLIQLVIAYRCYWLIWESHLRLWKYNNLSVSQSFRGSILLFLHSIIRLHILATQLHTGYGGMEREWSISTPMPQRSSPNSCLRVLFPPRLAQLAIIDATGLFENHIWDCENCLMFRHPKVSAAQVSYFCTQSPVYTYSSDSLKWRTHLIGALGPFWKVWKTHLNGAPKI